MITTSWTRGRARLVLLAASAGALLLACSADSTGPGAKGGPNAATRRLEALVPVEQLGAPGVTVAQAPRVRVTTAQGQPVAGAVVRFTVRAGGGAIALGMDTTDAQGSTRAVAWTLGARVGLNAVEARLDAAAGPADTASVAFLAMATAQPSSAPQVTVDPAGGVVHPTLSGSGIDSVTLTAPAGGVTAPVSLRLSTVPVPSPASLGGTSALARLRLSGDALEADSLLHLRIPVRHGPDELVLAYWYDSTTSRLEPVVLVASDSVSITLGLVSFGWTPVTAASSAGGALRSSVLQQVGRKTGAGRAANANLLSFVNDIILVTMKESALLASDTPTDFTVANDTWEFENRGSYVGSSGNCHGMTLSQLYYYDVIKRSGAPVLSSLRFTGDTVGALFGQENREAVRLVSMIQLDAQTSSLQLRMIREAWDIESDRLSLLQLVDALRRTRQPQLLAIASSRTASPKRAGHAIIVFGARVTASQVTLRVSDPNWPGIERSILYDRATRKYAVFPSGLTSRDDQTGFPLIRFIPRSHMPRWAMVGARFGEFDAAPQAVGDGDFPNYTLLQRTSDYENTLKRISRTIDTLPSTPDDTLELEETTSSPIIYAGGWRRIPGATGSPRWVEGTRFGRTGRIPLVLGENRVRILLDAEPPSATSAGRLFVDSRFVTVWRRPLALARTNGQVLPPADTIRFDSGTPRTFAIRFETGLPVYNLDSRQVTIVNPTGDAGVTIARTPFVSDTGRTDSLRITLSTEDTTVKRVRFDLAYRGRVFRTVIARVVRPSITLAPPAQTVTGARTSTAAGNGLTEHRLTCAMPWTAEVRGSNQRQVYGEEYRVTPASGTAEANQVTWSSAVTVTEGRYADSGSWYWRVMAASTEAPRFMPFDVEWRLRYRDPATGEEFLTNTIRLACR